MAVMRVEPAGHLIDVRPGESLIEAAWSAGYTWPTVCFGNGVCTVCQCEVLEGADKLSPRTVPEVQLLDDLTAKPRRRDPNRIRLACQARTSGDITVRKPGVVEADSSTSALVTE